MAALTTGIWSIENDLVIFTELGRRAVYTKKSIKEALDTVISRQCDYVTNEAYERQVEHFREGYLLSMTLK